MEPQRVSKPTEQKQTHASPSPALQPHVREHPLLQLQKAVGNQAFLQILRSGVLQTKLEVSQPGDIHEQVAEQVAQLTQQVMRMRERQPVEKEKNEHLVRAKETPPHVPEVAPAVHGNLDALRRGSQPKRAADSEKASALQAKKENEFLSAVDKGASKESAAEDAVEKEILRAPAIPEKAPVSPEEDPAYQAVVEQLEIKAEHEKTPNKKPEKKQAETKLAANLKPEEIDKQNAYDLHLNQLLEQVQPPPELTVEKFIGEFEKTINELAKKLPENKEKHNTVQTAAELGVGKAKAKQELANQNQTLSGPLRTVAKESASDYLKKQESKTYELKVDPAGSTPTIKNAETAAPKPKMEDEISLDDKSRALDNALLNHDVNGQKIDIDEGSLAFPISGEKTFDEAGEAKRKAQDEIQKAKPKYREEEKKVISESQGDIQSLVSTGLKGHYDSRSKSFDEVLDAQKKHASIIEGEKRTVFGKFERIYIETKKDVDDKLKELNGIEEIFESIISEAEKRFNDLVRNDLEYIYTPGIFDYSDWKEKHESEIKEEFEKLLSRGEDRLPAYAKALRIVRDRSAEILFEYAKKEFISYVTTEVKEKIAKIVVEALNAAKKHIKEGKEKANKAFEALDPKEKKEAKNVLDAVMGKFEHLEESVEDRQREINDDMARTYNKSVGKLKATFDEIKKDVLTSWFEKAWNKLKAIVNAIIEFATRIAELLGRIAGLVGDIVSSPRYFFKNLVTGIGQGFSTFVDRIDEFLATAFFDWLRGASGIQIQLPKDWGPKGIFSLFTQLLNLSTETIWERMEVVYDRTIANAFRRGEVLLGKGLEIFDIIKNEGLAGLWDHIKESLGNILEDTLGMIKETVLYAAIKKVIIEIGKMLVPGGGFIAIAEKVIRLVQFIVEARNKILDLIKSFIDSMVEAVKGNIPGIVKLITGALTKFITVALDFLVTFFGLGGMKEKVERFIERMRKPIIRGIDWVLGKVKPFVMKAMMKGKELIEKGKEKVRGVVQRVVQWWRTRKTFKAADGETHALFFRGEERRAVLTVSSTEMPYTDFVNRAQTGTDTAKVNAKQQGVTIAGLIDTERNTPPTGSTPEEIEKSSGQKATRINDLLEKLKKYTSILFGPTIPDSFTGNVNAGVNKAGFGVSMSVKPLTNKNRPAGSPPTTAQNDKYADINERRESPGGASYYVKGHLLNQELGGPGVWANLTPLSRSGNAQHERKAEAIVKRTVDLPAIVEYRVIPNYKAWTDKRSLLTRIKNSRDSADVKRVKSAIVEGEDWVPRSLSVQAYILDASLRQRNTILNQTITNPVERKYESYHLASSPRPVPVNLSDDDAMTIATLPDIGQTLAERIVAARRARQGRRFASYEQIAELVQGIGAGRLKTLEEAGHVRLY